MAGETLKTAAICLGIRPWSRTSHVVRWLTPNGRIVTIVKGAERPKSFFLGQYDVNYTCEILYYLGARGEVHAIRECFPLERRDGLRDNYRALLTAEYFRALVEELTPNGPEAAEWFELLAAALDRLAAAEIRGRTAADFFLRELLAFELNALDLAGLAPDLTAGEGRLALRGERSIPLSSECARCLAEPAAAANYATLSEAVRTLGVFLVFHLNAAVEIRRTLLRILSRRS